MLQELKDFQEQTHRNRPQGGIDDDVMNENWEERRQREKEIVDSEPTVTVIWAGEPYHCFSVLLRVALTFPRTSRIECRRASAAARSMHSGHKSE